MTATRGATDGNALGSEKTRRLGDRGGSGLIDPLPGLAAGHQYSIPTRGRTDIVQDPVDGGTAGRWLPHQQSDGSWQLERPPGPNQDFTAH